MNIFDTKMDAIINPVNCVGVMGKGLALEFKNKYPENFLKYKKVCDNNELTIGKCFTTFENGKYIVNFPTKNHWKNKSEYSYIEEGMLALIRHINHYNIKSISIPKLGCGLGGLEWNKVKQIIVDNLQPLINDKQIIVEFNE